MCNEERRTVNREPRTESGIIPSSRFSIHRSSVFCRRHIFGIVRHVFSAIAFVPAVVHGQPGPATRLTDQAGHVGGMHVRQSSAGTNSIQRTEGIDKWQRTGQQQSLLGHNLLSGTQGQTQFYSQYYSQTTEQIEQLYGIQGRVRAAGTNTSYEVGSAAAFHRLDGRQTQIGSGSLAASQGFGRFDQILSSTSKEHFEQPGSLYGRERAAGANSTRSSVGLNSIRRFELNEKRAGPGSLSAAQVHSRIDTALSSHTRLQTDHAEAVQGRQRATGTAVLQSADGMTGARELHNRRAQVASGTVSASQVQVQLERSASSHSSAQAEQLGAFHVRRQLAGAGVAQSAEAIHRSKHADNVQVQTPLGHVEATAQFQRLLHVEMAKYYEQGTQIDVFAGPRGVRGIQQQSEPGGLQRSIGSSDASSLTSSARKDGKTQPYALEWDAAGTGAARTER